MSVGEKVISVLLCYPVPDFYMMWSWCWCVFNAHHVLQVFLFALSLNLKQGDWNWGHNFQFPLFIPLHISIWSVELNPFCMTVAIRKATGKVSTANIMKKVPFPVCPGSTRGRVNKSEHNCSQFRNSLLVFQIRFFNQSWFSCKHASV